MPHRRQRRPRDRVAARLARRSARLPRGHGVRRAARAAAARAARRARASASRVRTRVCRRASRGPRRRLQPVEVLDPGEHAGTRFRVPEARLLHRRERLLLHAPPVLRFAVHRLELCAQEGRFGFRAVRVERDRRERQRAVGCRQIGRLLGRVRVDEGDLEACAGARRDEQELVALGERALDDRLRERRRAGAARWRASAAARRARR